MEELLIEDYNYPLSDERIAKYPLSQRDRSKLLIYKEGKVGEDVFCHIGDSLPADTLLVYNNTRVIQARLIFHKATGARIEVFCLEPLSPHDYQLNLSSTDGCTWKCMVGNLKKWKGGALSTSVTLDSGMCELSAELISTMGNTHEVRFSWDNTNVSFAELLDAMGELPIPPYLNRATEESDKTTYQTVYSRIKGSVAAPTAGLHFTDDVLADLHCRGIEITELTLHVGAGTFQPVKTADANMHTMHTEIISVPVRTLYDLRRKQGHICAVGTTSMRTLESLYYIGVRLAQMARTEWKDCNLHVEQFEPYEKEYDMSLTEALEYIVEYLKQTGQEALHAETQIMIKPGYRFRVVDMLITNFHQPKSTLLLLVSAFVGGDWKHIYDYALAHDFRFLSYGDSSLLFRTTTE
ncbi:MAG: S-adenosylmethionine:tRNA ribosyltransferase-isomerase [Paludibacter sp.]|nr:S-adenosylmethionine:tRNA ribosyltransferase-isomerase [Bacteroidales bacterium]MCM1068682.1 S-adenosylmethionine:tRNA ribosyltransferase-isomerase [Prevotella sp.]MCM1353346.1 S-adenosylmethionine:tRNA ribosyltransferase-isomerase [Bacteroides sp.]MCM1442246.1 S-adenosylmethionine:tRNA ribosyltransferase-isomerase [Muribaculum sp.]MCM1481065.1 S-adenosylmethionine:tRNA ribosyltransferase-isomerase [Paludibacter sp.]